MDGKEHVSELLPAYALDILDEAETLQVSLHLADCGYCQAELERFQEVSDQLSMAVTEAQPPESVKTRLLDGINSHAAQTDSPKPGTWHERFSFLSHSAFRVWAVVSLVLLAGLLLSNILLWQQISRPEITGALRVIHLVGEEPTTHARGMLVVSIDGEHGTLVVDRLALLEPEFEYQLWMFHDGEFSSGGTFKVYESGYGHTRIDSDQPLMYYDRFIVTIEVEGGSQSPSGPVVLSGDL